MAIFCTLSCGYNAGDSGNCLDERYQKICGDGKLTIMMAEKKGPNIQES